MRSGKEIHEQKVSSGPQGNLPTDNSVNGLDSDFDCGHLSGPGAQCVRSGQQ